MPEGIAFGTAPQIPVPVGAVRDGKDSAAVVVALSNAGVATMPFASADGTPDIDVVPSLKVKVDDVPLEVPEVDVVPEPLEGVPLTLEDALAALKDWPDAEEVTLPLDDPLVVLEDKPDVEAPEDVLELRPGALVVND